MDRMLMARRLDRAILGLILAILVFGPLALGAVQTWSFLAVEGLAILAAWGGLARLWLAPRDRLLWTPVAWGAAFFIVYALIRYATADIEYVARQELVRVLVYGLIFLTVLQRLHRQESVRSILMALVFLGLALALYALFQYVTQSPRVWHLVKPEQYLGRGSGTYICPNHLAGFLEMTLPLALGLVFLGRVSVVTRILVGYAALVMAAGLGVTVSRGGWLAMGLALLVFALVLTRSPGLRWPAWIMVAVLGIGAILFARQVFARQNQWRHMIVGGQIEEIRFRIWRPALQIWWRHPLWGAGPGHFDSRFREFRPETIQMRPDRVHNDYLNTLADWGVAGAALVAGTMGLLFSGAAKTWRFVGRQVQKHHRRGSTKAAAVLGAATGLIAILGHSFVDFNMHVPANAILAITLMAILSGHSRFSTDRYWAAPGRKLRLAYSIALLAITFGLAWQGVRAGREAASLRKAGREPQYSVSQYEALAEAFRREPKNPGTAYDLGEIMRIRNWEKDVGNPDGIRQAMEWYRLAWGLSPYHGYAWMRYGMCLDWLGRHEEAGEYFARALSLDPNGYFMAAHQGWHSLQIGDYAKAQSWFERSLELQPYYNHIAVTYLDIVRRRLEENTRNEGLPLY
ncbi:MAG TPA: O-antigen ligase family protein [Candidatus Paceibacterota bacterium]|nr:O-antigen ligase family protein [Verrucomicrobiota bacterium]HRZ45594.1 O-antigen ligase family protein [Candidatus Paceibacterota bacterium]HRZ91403.1 O-antigen ligase family protein [Candidatus Paceibacterota bacterium]